MIISKKIKEKEADSMKRVYEEDAYNLGLLYKYIYSNQKTRKVKLDNLISFYQTIEANLEEMHSKYSDLYATVLEEEQIHKCEINSNAEKYLVLREGIDLEKSLNIYLTNLSPDTIAASKMENALKCLGLTKDELFEIDEDEKRLVKRKEISYNLYE